MTPIQLANATDKELRNLITLEREFEFLSVYEKNEILDELLSRAYANGQRNIEENLNR